MYNECKQLCKASFPHKEVYWILFGFHRWLNYSYIFNKMFFFLSDEQFYFLQAVEDTAAKADALQEQSSHDRDHDRDVNDCTQS